MDEGATQDEKRWARWLNIGRIGAPTTVADANGAAGPSLKGPATANSISGSLAD